MAGINKCFQKVLQGTDKSLIFSRKEQNFLEAEKFKYVRVGLRAYFTEYQKRGVEKRWLARKVFALPVVLFWYPLVVMYNLGKLLVLSIGGKRTQAKFAGFHLSRQLEKMTGRFLTLFHDRLGSYLIADGDYHIKCYKAHFRRKREIELENSFRFLDPTTATREDLEKYFPATQSGKLFLLNLSPSVVRSLYGRWKGYHFRWMNLEQFKAAASNQIPDDPVSASEPLNASRFTTLAVDEEIVRIHDLFPNSDVGQERIALLTQQEDLRHVQGLLVAQRYSSPFKFISDTQFALLDYTNLSFQGWQNLLPRNDEVCAKSRIEGLDPQCIVDQIAHWPAYAKQWITQERIEALVEALPIETSFETQEKLEWIIGRDVRGMERITHVSDALLARQLLNMPVSLMKHLSRGAVMREIGDEEAQPVLKEKLEKLYPNTPTGQANFIDASPEQLSRLFKGLSPYHLPWLTTAQREALTEDQRRGLPPPL